MSSIRRRPGRRRLAVAVTALTACLALTATACSDEEAGGGDPSASNDASGQDDRLQDVIDNLPFDLDLDAYMDGEWRNWDRDTWLREIGDFVNPIIEDLWDPDRMGDAEDPEQEIDEGQIDEDPQAPDNDNPDDDRGITDPEPSVVDAVEAPTPYSDGVAPIGRVFFDTPEGSMVCSGTVISDPNAPGESNLVATAGHCVHAGSEGGWYRNISFVPYYNNNGLSAEEVYDAPLEEIAPQGVWWADYVSTTQYWVDNGSAMGGGGAHGDFAVLSVTPEEGGDQSLEEMVGGAVDVNFDAPAVSGLGEVDLYGYPAAAPYDGETMWNCTGTPSRLSLDAAMPVMYWAGCSMTGGSSGGPWLRTGDSGEPELISVNSIGPVASTWLAGPRLEDEAEGVVTEVSSNG